LNRSRFVSTFFKGLSDYDASSVKTLLYAFGSTLSFRLEKSTFWSVFGAGIAKFKLEVSFCGRG